MKPKSSLIWNYFDEVSADTAKCKLCLKDYSRKGRTTTSLKSHLKSMHGAEYEQYNESEVEKITQPSTSTAMLQEAKKQITIKDTLQINQKWCNNDPKSTEIDRLISEMIALEELPFNFVAGNGFRRLLQFVAPNYQLRDRQFYTDYTCDDSDSCDSAWSFFERTEHGPRCAVCRALVPPGERRRHLRDHHPKLNNTETEEVEYDTTNNSQDEVYTEVVFLEQEDSPDKIKTDEKEVIQPRKSAGKRKRRVSSSSDDEPLKKIKNKKNESDDEIEQFVKYVACLLKKLPQDTCMELQMEIVNLILKKQLGLKRKDTSVLAVNNMAAVRTADNSENNKEISNSYAEIEEDKNSE